MRYFAAFLISLFFVLASFASMAKSEAIGIDDLLNPEDPYTDDNIEKKLPLAKTPKRQVNIDDILGPNDIFPFLPDNHRDSGTGKFNSF